MNSGSSAFLSLLVGIRRCVCDSIMPPHITVFVPSNIAASTFEYHNFLDVLHFRVGQCFIDILLQWEQHGRHAPSSASDNDFKFESIIRPDSASGRNRQIPLCEPRDTEVHASIATAAASGTRGMYKQTIAFTYALLFQSIRKQAHFFCVVR